MCPWTSDKLEVFRFNGAIVRQPARSVAGGLRAHDRGDPTSLGYTVVPLETSEIGKIDAGLSCMSLRWWDPASG